MENQLCWDLGIASNVSLSYVDVPEGRNSSTSSARNLEREFWEPTSESVGTPNLKADAAPVAEKVTTKVPSSTWNMNLPSGILNSRCESPPPKIDLVAEKSPVNASSRTENETRPTVLMLAGSASNKVNSPQSPSTRFNNNEAKVVVIHQEEVLNLPVPEDNQKWLGALALMELAKTQEEEAVKALTFRRVVETCDNINYIHL